MKVEKIKKMKAFFWIFREAKRNGMNVRPSLALNQRKMVNKIP